MIYTIWICLLVFAALPILFSILESRTEGRQRRLNTFRSVLPLDVRTEYEEIVCVFLYYFAHTLETGPVRES